MAQFITALKRYPVLQNWVALTFISLLCYAFVAWYFMSAATVFEWSRPKTIGWLGALLWFVVWASAYRYNKIAKQIAWQDE